ncbi:MULTISPECIES: Ig-like domain-containing protein [unclassified Agromyces]|uniref:Ig-like domain-containing protein n=1 Tax=unclassified Agromyces TaxID=2639701 RepID=UPI0030149DA6
MIDAAELWRTRRAPLLTAGAVGVVVAVVAGVAVASGGYTAQRVDLGDAAVWVANEAYESVGRANTAVHELNAVVEAGGTRPEVVQGGSTVLVLDRDRASVGIVDPATATVADTVAVPPTGTEVALAGDRVVITADGDLWVQPVEEFGRFLSEREPAFEFGAESVVSVDESGRVFGFTPSTGEITLVGADAPDAVVEEWQLDGIDRDGDVQVTSVGGRWAVLDAGARRLHLEGRTVDLAGLVSGADGAVLQRPSLAGDGVLIATRERLVEVGFDGGAPTVLVDGRRGVPAAPILHGGCVHAAWGGGTAWRACGDDREGREFPLERRIAGEGPRFLANGDALVLNDPQSGATWAASGRYELIDNWEELLAVERDERQVEQNDPESRVTTEKSQVPPVAVDDEFGARPGRATLLPVLLNDYDANGDVLVVAAASGDLPDGVRVDLVSERQQLQLTLDDRAAGSFDIRYDIDDGRGGVAQAVARVTVRAPDENGPPAQVRPTRGVVESSGRVTTAVLGEWVDPDGDPMFLRSASTASPDDATSTAEGVVVFDERGGEGSERRVALIVSDGRDDGAGTLRIDVRAPGEAPLVAESFVALATAGEEIRLEPLRHVRGGSGQARLSAVPAKPEAQLAPDFDNGTFRFSSAAVRTHFLEYTVTDGDQTATGSVRVEVAAPPERDTTPITVPHTAFLRLDQPMEVDVLAGDIDPTGGLLVITGPGEAPDDPGVRVEVIDHRMLRVSLTRPLEQGSARFGYRVSNGLADAEGTVTVVQVPPPATPQPPVAAPDTASARTGDVVDIPVLDNDAHPDGDPLELDPELVTRPSSGLLFAAGNRLRFQAPDEPGVFEASYRVTGPDGQNATASVVITVREADAETNSPPVPATAAARVLAGDTVRIPIPLGGVDPDGDSVQLLGQESNPERGAVVDRGTDWLEYQAGEYSAGTDTFEYAVVDALGARATGVVRVGIAPGLDGARAPVAVDDRITVRPGRSLAVRVLANDSDPDGGELVIADVESNTGTATAEADGDVIRVDVPEGDADHSFIYTVENERLGSTTAFLRVDARADAPLIRPEAADVVLSLSDVLEEEQVEVDVLDDVFIADADHRDASVSLVEGHEDGARVTGRGTIEVEVRDRRRIVPYAVGHPDDPDLRALAFIWVPGRDDALPQLRRDAPPVRVESGEEVVLELEDHVVAASGRPVRLTDAASVRASHADGTDLVVDEDTLRFRSEPGYFGPASISFTVTDGDSADDPDGRTGTIVIPIDVRPTDDQPPTFVGGVIDFEPGQSRTIALERLTNRPDDGSDAELAFRIVGEAPPGFDVAIDGGDLRVRAAESTQQGTGESVTIGVADGPVEGTPGRIELRVVPSTRPIAQPAADTAIAPRGRTTTVDVLANDAAGNPFPDTPLRVVAVRGLDAGNLPSGVAITPSADRSRLSVTVSEGAAPINTAVQYQVADATGDRSRFAWGTVTVSVQDRPDPVTDARLTGFGDGTVDVAFGAGAFNNSPIEGYRISLLDPGDGREVGATECAATTCTVATPGNGPGSAVRVRIQARNGIGLSDPAELPTPVWSDVIPAPPGGLRALPLDGRLRIEWAPVPAGSGSPVDRYVVSVAGSPVEVSASRVCTASVCATESQQLANGSSAAVAVSARNGAFPALAQWTEATTTGTPFGAPIPGDIAVDADPAAGAVVVSWTPFAGNGDAMGGYYVERLVEGESSVPSGAQACSVTQPAPGTVVAPSAGGTVAEVVRVGPDVSSVSFTGTSTESARYSFVVWGFNRAGCVHTAVASTVVRPAPGGVTGVDSTMDWLNAETWDRYVSDVEAGTRRLQIIAVDANGVRVGTAREFSGSGWLRALLNRPFGETARFQVRACTVWGSCGPWSQTQPGGESPSLTFALPGRAYDPAEATWTWTADPANGGLPTAYRCGLAGESAGRPAQSATSCQVPGASAGDRVWLDVEVAGVTARFEAR